MNLFRSEDDVRRWSGFKADTAAGILTLDQALAVMSTPRQRDRLNGRYVSSFPTYGPPFFTRLAEVTGDSPYWHVG